MNCMALVLQVVVMMPAGDDKKNEFANTESLTITYRVSGRDKVLTVTDSKKVKEVIQSLDIHKTSKGTFAGSDFEGKIGFKGKDESEIEVFFVSPDMIERIHWGLIELKTKSFYEKINKLASENEGRKIDILKDNE